jgi:hypothetical protein
MTNDQRPTFVVRRSSFVVLKRRTTMKRLQVIRHTWLLGVVALTLVLLAAWALPGGLAQKPVSDAHAAIPEDAGVAESVVSGGAEGVVPGSAPLWDDGGPWEVGVETAGGTLSAYAASEGSALFNRLKSCGWNGRYNYAPPWAWEEDFKRSGGPGGGMEWRYLDTVDLQFYVGHGWSGGFTFDPPLHDDAVLEPSDCNRAWGDDDNEWVALTSCEVLNDANLWPWSQCMNGGHLILGFKTGAGARWGTDSQGYHFANYLCNGWTVPGAWYKACDRSQSSGTVVRSLINELAYLNDKPMCGAPVCPLPADSYDTDAWVQTHSCGSEPARPVASAVLNGTMPIFRTPPLSLAEAQSKYSHLGTVFGVTPTLMAVSRVEQGDEVWRDVSNGRELEMDPDNGLYGFYDMNNLWTTQQAQSAYLAKAAAVTDGDARAIADEFLRRNGLMAGDARFYEVISDTISGGPVASDTAESATASLLANPQPTLWQVIYSRILTYTVAGALGSPVDTVEFSVVGPGAKQKVYVSTGATLAGVDAQTPILGVIGGWHRVEQPGAAGGPAATDTVPILTPQQIYKLYEQLEKLVVLNTPPINADGRQIISHTLAYWEEGVGANQSELTPVYALRVRYTLAGAEVLVDYAYVPANQRYMRPFARIESAPSGQVRVGQVITLTATDASRTLADLGYDASLNFALGSGDYMYDWYVGSVAEANRIGSGRTFRYTVRPDAEFRSGRSRQTIVLKVTDIGSADLRSTVADVSLDVQPRILMPVIRKQR